MNQDKQATGLVKTAAARFQWEGKIRYKGRSYLGCVLATTYEEAVFEFLADALAEWFGEASNQDGKIALLKANGFTLKLKDSLDTVITRYALSKKYNDPTTAENQCIIASNRLKKFIEGLGFEATQYMLKHPFEQFPQAVTKWRKVSSPYWKHHVIGVGNRIYDLTFRQFDPNSPYPFFTTLTEVKKKWKEIYLEELNA